MLRCKKLNYSKVDLPAFGNHTSCFTVSNLMAHAVYVRF